MESRLRPSVVVGMVYASTAVAWTSYSLLSVSLPFRFQALGLSVVQYGVAMAAFALGMLATESVWGIFAFRIGKPWAILVLGLAVLVLYLTIAMATGFLALTVALALFGMLIIFPVPLFRWMAMIAGGPGTEGSGTGRYGVFFGAGMVLGSAMGPFLYVTLGFRDLMLVIMATYAAGLALMVLLPWGQTRLPRGESGSFSLVRRVLTSPFLFAAGLAVAGYIALSLVVNFLQIYSVDTFHGTPAEAGYVIGGARAILLLAGFALGGTVDRWRPIRTVPFGFALIALGALGTLVAPSYLEMVGATLVLAAGMGWLSAALLPLALESTPVPLQGTAVGVFGSFEDLGLLVGPVVISAAYAAYGARSIFLLVGVIAIAAAVAPLLVHRLARHGTRRPVDFARSLGPGP